MRIAATEEIAERLALPAGLALGILVVLDPFLGALVRIQGKSPTDIAPYTTTALLIPLGVILYGTLRRIAEFVRGMGYQRFFFYVATALLYLSALERAEVSLTLTIFLAIWIARLALGEERRLVVTPLVALTLILMTWCTITMLSPHGVALGPTAGRLSKLYLKLVMVILVLQAIRSEQDLAGFLRLSIVLALLSTLVAIGQIAIYRATGVNYSFTPPGVSLLETTPWGLAPRTTAFFNHPNSLGTQIAITLVILLYLIIPPTALSLRRRWRYALVILFCMISIFFSFSRGSWVGMTAGLLVIYYLKAPHLFLQKTLALILLVTILFVTGAFEWAYTQMVALNPGSVGVRFDLLQLGIKCFKEYPLLGYGYDQFTLYSGNLWRLAVHSFPVQLASETGAPGLLIYLCLIVYLLARMGRIFARTSFFETRLICGAFLTAAVAFLINNLFYIMSLSNTVFHFFALQEAFCLLAERREREGRPMVLWPD